MPLACGAGALRRATMLKVVWYAIMKHNYSSRKIRRACRQDINYIRLVDGAPAPSHFEIAWFRSSHLSERVCERFSQLVDMLYEMGKVEFAHLFVDGTKIEANAKSTASCGRRTQTSTKRGWTRGQRSC